MISIDLIFLCLRDYVKLNLYHTVNASVAVYTQ